MKMKYVCSMHCSCYAIFQAVNLNNTYYYYDYLLFVIINRHLVNGLGRQPAVLRRESVSV